MKSMKIISAAMAAIMAVSFSGCSGFYSNDSSQAKNPVKNSADDNAVSSLSEDDISVLAEDKDVGYEETDSTGIVFSGTDAEINGKGAALSDGVLTISEAGCYVLSGSFKGQIYVKSKGSEIKLVLNGVSVANDTNAALLVDKAQKVTLTLNDGTENSFSDGSSYTLSDDDDSTDAAVFARSDLTINGGGSLSVNGSYKHGIVCKDELVVTGGDITVEAASTGIKGKDAVKISGGTLNITAGSNGIAATNDEDETKGFVAVTGGTVVINSEGDGIQAETTLRIEDGNIDITTGGGSANAEMKTEEFPGGFGGGNMTPPNGSDGSFPDNMTPPEGFDGNMTPLDGFPENMTPPDGFDGSFPDNMTPPDGFGGGNMGDRPDKPQGNGQTDKKPDDTKTDDKKQDETKTTDSAQTEKTEQASSDTESDVSAKALKAGKAVEIAGGSINIDSKDDSVNSGGNVSITKGTLTASAGDDGIHADSDIEISGGTVEVNKSYEGIEGLNIIVSGGSIKVTASDDGFSAAGGSDTGSADRIGRDSFNTSDSGKYSITISGGDLFVNANGDGLDSNGNIYVSGGTIVVEGPTNGGNGAIDYGDFGSMAEITGGTIIAVGAVGMESGFGDTSTQYSILHNFSSTVEAGKEFSITDSEGNVLYSFTPEKTWQSVVFSNAKLAEGTYTLKAGDQSETVEITSIVTSNSTGMSFGGNKPNSR